jgi:Carboxypeptidase regulatory-like domain
MIRRGGIAWMALMLLLAGCGRAVVEGRVVDERGEGLPGVAVMVAGGDRQALTDARGHYRFVCPPGIYNAAYAKSGYTLETGTVDTSNRRWNTQETVSLWNLPPKDGVFIYEDHRYVPAEWMVPKQFFMRDGSMSYGIQRVPEVYTDDDMPRIMFYKMPRYDVQLSRLQVVTAKLPADDSQTFSVWTAAGTMTTDLTPVAAADPSLLQLEVTEPLQPGTYAIHWGALDGYSTINERIYLFDVREPVMPEFEHVEPRMELTPTKEERQKSKPAAGDAP